MTTEAGGGTQGGAGAGGGAQGGAGAGTGAAGTGTPAWHGLTEQADIEYVGNKGWQNTQQLYKSYRAAETFLGRNPDELLTRPKDGDAEGWNRVFDRLGRPSSAEKYNMKSGLPDGLQMDESFTKPMAAIFHKHGLTEAQANGIAQEYNQMLAKSMQETDVQARTSVAADKASLVREWGGGYERMMNSAQTAVAALGFTAAEIDAMENVLGYKGVMQKFAALGQKLSDPQFVSGDNANTFSDVMTPAEAKNEIEKLKLDKEFKAAMYGGPTHPSRKAAQEKWSQLHSIAYGNDPVR